jgi:hypothetical protein
VITDTPTTTRRSPLLLAYVVLVGGALVALVVLSIVVSRRPSSFEISETIAEHLTDAADDGSVVVLADILEFEWETVHIFRGGSSREEVEAELGPAADEVVDDITDVDYGGESDGSHLVFTTDGRIVATSLVSPVLMPDDGDAGGLTIDEARFRAERSTASGREMVLGHLVAE